ncbi:DUF4893 domain-containing protein [Aquamicrobium sp. LC103]|uniref:DUF4893 domain-containing protein n=1 Tax=Aquamicrobium sp. LC103 TaxID=1120658 RepID=UPI00063EA71F|nr:DUF4893 domain-containing protein [Aquamicrobium sp. LC103]TKT80045.1 DUF4893 domain-containing protein [Aquamicrobium sp. LC103]
MSFRLAATSLTLLAALSSPAGATGEIESLITPADRARLEAYDQTREGALAEAKEKGKPEDVTTLDEVLVREAISFEDFDMTGNWQCRTIKAGGEAALVVYGWFRCQVTDDGSGWHLQKLTGSQRTNGRFFTDSDTRLTYLGTFSVNNEQALPYGTSQDSDQAGYAFRTGKNAWRIEFPAPRYESKFDILEFRR